MKKDVVLTIRVDDETARAIRDIADDERTAAWVARKLIIEALEHRGVLRPSRGKSSSKKPG